RENASPLLFIQPAVISQFHRASPYFLAYIFAVRFSQVADAFNDHAPHFCRIPEYCYAHPLYYPALRFCFFHKLLPVI
ncbi:hypothetical protein, partial [Atlantibacter hermannii]|uniref:hypothetical protein n=1 Tax=Atlantibacter hermannii TaxID=565 RepID=UPI002FDDFAFA